MATLESRGYVATDDDITAIARTVLTAHDEAATGRASYLRTLIATTQSEMGVKPRMRASAKPTKLEQSQIDAQLASLEEVHKRFYELVFEAAEAAIPSGTKDRGIEVNRRTNFARTAMSIVRRFVRAGNDLTVVVPARATRDSLRVADTTIRTVPTSSLKRKAEAQSKALMATVIGLADADRKVALEELTLLLNQVTDQMMRLGVTPTKDASQATEESRPLRVGKSLFIPTASQVLAQHARPA